jgi:hypothetical protein
LNAVAAGQQGDVPDCMTWQRYRHTFLRSLAALTEIRHHHADKWRGAGVLDRAPLRRFNFR